MPAIRDRINQVLSAGAADDQADLTLGLPLETETARVYPVFRTWGPHTDGHRNISQIGYLEVSANRSDYVSLEPRSRIPFIIAAVTMLALLLGAIVRRLRY